MDMMRERTLDAYRVQEEMMTRKDALEFNKVPYLYNTAHQQYNTMEPQYNTTQPHYNPAQYNQLRQYNEP
jgi:hypothetical protein